jgi:tetratricopeptide (TPR) repeat protein
MMKDPNLADATVEVLQQKCANHPQYAYAMSWTAYEYCRAGFYPQAMELYNTVLSLKPNEDIQMRCIAGIAQVYVRLGDDAKVQEKVDYLLSNFKDNPAGVASCIFGIGEEYYLMAEDVAKAGAPNQVKACYEKALALWQRFEADVPNHNTPEYAYFSGLSYQRLAQYEQAINCYQKVILKWPQYERAWDAQAMMIECYKQLKADNKLDASKADAAIQKAYRNILENYPDCPAAKMASRQLKSSL